MTYGSKPRLGWIIGEPPPPLRSKKLGKRPHWRKAEVALMLEHPGRWRIVEVFDGPTNGAAAKWNRFDGIEAFERLDAAGWRVIYARGVQ